MGTSVERSMPSARASAICESPWLRSTSTSRPNSPGVNASPAPANAPAKMPEFKGSVVNVLTENCWDRLQTTADKKRGEVNAKIKKMKNDGRKFAKGEEQELSAKMLSEACTPEELEALKGISNFAFHSWIRDGLLANKPYDVFVRELLGDFGVAVNDEQLDAFLLAEHIAWAPARRVGAAEAVVAVEEARPPASPATARPRR